MCAQGDWEVEPLPDNVGRMVEPLKPFQIPTRGYIPLYRNPEWLREQQMKGEEGLAALGEEDAAAAAAAELAGAACARHEFVHLTDLVQKRVAGLLRMHVLGSVRSRIEAGHLDFINEIRPLTCLFLGFPTLLDPRDDVTHNDQIDSVQYAVAAVQNVMRKWDGSLLQFRCDEKGFVAICAFGLPAHTHEDNPSRGILAALELHKRIKENGHRVSIGVTTGDLLCTCVGARKIRSEYTVFGDAINLSARLMVKCKKGGGGEWCVTASHCVTTRMNNVSLFSVIVLH